MLFYVLCRMWKSFTDTHEISTEGEICNKRGMILKQHLHKDRGYKQIVITMDCNKAVYYTHRVVATTFIPNPDNLPEVDHINNDRTDNHVENLRWVSKSHNCQNKPVRADSKTGVKGINRRANGKYTASCLAKGHRRYIGIYDTLEEAVIARLKIVAVLHTCPHSSEI